MKRILFAGFALASLAFASPSHATSPQPTFGVLGGFGTFGSAQSQSVGGGTAAGWAWGSAGLNVSPQGANGFQTNSTGAFSQGNGAAMGQSTGFAGMLGGFTFRMPAYR